MVLFGISYCRDRYKKLLHAMESFDAAEVGLVKNHVVILMMKKVNYLKKKIVNMVVQKWVYVQYIYYFL